MPFNLKRLLTFLSAAGLVMVLVISSCSKKEDPGPSSGDYMPTSAGSHWTYTGDIPYTLTMTGNTAVFDGKTYFEGETTYSGQSTLGYVYKEGGNYYNRGLVSLGVDSLSTDTLEVIILKDNVPVGTAWSQTVEVDTLSYTYRFKIDEKDISHTVSGKTYNNVIKVKLDLELDFFGVPFVFATQYVYFAKGVGMIHTELTALFTPALHANLSDYEIK